MRAIALPNGNLLVPVPAYETDADGNIVAHGDGMVEVEPGTELFDAWGAFADADPTVR